MKSCQYFFVFSRKHMLFRKELAIVYYLLRIKCDSFIGTNENFWKRVEEDKSMKVNKMWCYRTLTNLVIKSDLIWIEKGKNV